MSEFSSQPSGLLKVLPMKELEIGGRKGQIGVFFFFKGTQERHLRLIFCEEGKSKRRNRKSRRSKP